MVIVSICVLGGYVDGFYGFLARPARCGTPAPTVGQKIIPYVLVRNK